MTTGQVSDQHAIWVLSLSLIPIIDSCIKRPCRKDTLHQLEHMYIYIYIYRERERERESDRSLQSAVPSVFSNTSAEHNLSPVSQLIDCMPVSQDPLRACRSSCYLPIG